MRLKGDFSITLTGSVIDVVLRENVQPALGYLLTRLLTGGNVAPEALRPWGISVEEITLVKRVDMQDLREG